MSNANTIRSSYLGVFTDETPEQIAATLVGEWGSVPAPEDMRVSVELRYLLWSDADVDAIVAALSAAVAS